MTSPNPTATISIDSLNRGDPVTCDECGDRFRVIDIGHKLSAVGSGRVIEHYDASTGTATDVSFYCSGECWDVNAPPCLARIPDDADTASTNPAP